MATIKRGILGGVSGKVGNVVGGSWNGVDYLRSLPSAVRQPNTILQQNQRGRFSLISSLIRPLSSLLRIGFRAEAAGMTAYNAAFSYNFRNALTEDANGTVLDFSKVLLSKGNLSAASGVTAVSTQAAQVVLQWTDNSNVGMAAATDYLYYVVIDPSTMESVFQINAGFRGDTTCTVELPAALSGKTLHCYIGFFSVNSIVSNAPRNGIANSTYAGELVLM